MSERAILAGGCFWGMEELFRHLPGVIGTRVGYAGGAMENPTYNDIKTGKTGHAEALEIIFDPTLLPYRKVLEFFFQIHDPTTPNRQGNDRGSQYRSLILYLDDGQRETAAQLMTEMDRSGKWPDPFVTELEPAGTFYPAEEYHQDYLQKNIGGYTCHFIRPDWVLDR